MTFNHAKQRITLILTILNTKIMALNRCEFIGNLGKKAEIRMAGDARVATFQIAVTKRGFTTKTGAAVPEKTTWVTIVAWRALSDLVEKWTDKGSKIYVAGELSIRSYERDGETKYVTEIVAEQIELLSQKPEAAQPAPAPVRRQPEYPEYSNQPEPGNPDLPF